MRDTAHTFTATGSPEHHLPHQHLTARGVSCFRFHRSDTPTSRRSRLLFYWQGVMPLPPFAMHRCRVEHRNDACSRLSLPQTTTAAPPPVWYIGGRLSLALPHGLPVFIGWHAARRRRYRFPHNPSRALRYPEPKQNNLVDLLQSSWNPASIPSR